jgi:hypothetical protein
MLLILISCLICRIDGVGRIALPRISLTDVDEDDKAAAAVAAATTADAADIAQQQRILDKQEAYRQSLKEVPKRNGDTRLGAWRNNNNLEQRRAAFDRLHGPSPVVPRDPTSHNNNNNNDDDGAATSRNNENNNRNNIDYANDDDAAPQQQPLPPVYTRRVADERVRQRFVSRSNVVRGVNNEILARPALPHEVQGTAQSLTKLFTR